ncbi:MAG: hypothetical protein ACD_40C00150G0001 [uncultured bacterium]|nr:MAG: hypothetical protein ACD_40C00150G0001 [uncultured bacterium]KKU21260.1 MAG: hypothetical protein UX32_C0005G0037 [Microgenomates group bacterium GW2011_GWF1_46_12]KKU26377.1 MAG: hypothetical protein UX38_C0006G0003 [Microgenomates group bacterium GW2011_GWC1_46_16]KKU27785.1 MAG: hypothetical protein UX40_C0006G0007 [Microgenomates group bacterium GW2011_GWF2_46_18]KKU45425.1 MAG: hypothetical protein UX63_C0006G0038 [Microgenomates group bacterium GW2011_GWB1_46_7]KKU60303.1 MAG: hy
MNKINEQVKSKPGEPEPKNARVTGREIAKISELIPDPKDQELVPINRIKEALEKLKKA